MSNCSPENPLTQPVAVDERFLYKKTPRTLGGSTSRWNVGDYFMVKAKGRDDKSVSPFKAMASPGKDERFLEVTKKREGKWKASDYNMVKAKGQDDNSVSPFKSMADPNYDTFAHTRKQRGTPRWNVGAYRDGLKKSPGVSIGKNSGKNHPLYAKSGAKDYRFEGTTRGTPRWDAGPYRAFKINPGTKGSSGGESPLKVMAEMQAQGHSPADHFARNGRVGDFSAREAQSSFLDNQRTAASIKRATSGHGGGGAGEAIFGPGH